ncbi:signal peptide peptidase SppA [Oleiagrimonas sp. C23AA]|uniref:signal peptide peptidase SppA n=1 Tax=Oleiagrimonas sp. C23AA TaxID=2719047 RepID=UPI00141DE16F|nr:signal peptide peptidase SppA [Oleiagrimonas sp. C23AA]NII11972.1 signal peptide peptidase SppA [Oleiagrimonas sp. C23AA]
MSARKPNGFVAFIGVILRGINVVRIVILNVIFFGLLAIIIAAANRSAPLVRSHTVLVLKPQGELVEQYSIDPVQRVTAKLAGQAVQQVQVRDLVGAIKRAAHDGHIQSIVLMPGELRAGGFAALREVAAALDRFRATGKKVTVWAPQLDQSQYYLAAHADTVLVDPQGGVMVTGLASYRLYYKDLLDKLGVTVHLFRVGQFKSAAEPYVLDQASDQAKQADRFWMGGLWDQWMADVGKARHIDPATLRTAIDAMPEQIKAHGGDLAKLDLADHLVDGLATRAQLIARLRSQGALADDDGHGVRSIDMEHYLASVSPPRPRHASAGNVAIVVAEGEITGGSQPPGHIGGDSTAALIRRAREDSHVKALVLRVDSPGGEVYAAEQIRREVALTRQAGKPVIVSMGDVAASGGYWISMNANRIYAEPNTITGSIGIFGMLYNVPDTLAKLGVHSDGIGVGPLAGAFDVTRPLDPKVATMMQSMIDKGYRDFVGGVAKARHMSYAQVNTVAQGRVWTGRQALERGLVDKLGGLRAAVADAAKTAGLDQHFGVRYVEPRMSGFQRFMQGIGQSSMAHIMLSAGIRLPSWTAELARRAPELGLFGHAQAGKPNVYAYCFCSPQD